MLSVTGRVRASRKSVIFFKSYGVSATICFICCPARANLGFMSLAQFNERVLPGAQKLGGWRALYLTFIDQLNPRSILEIGCGGTAFLERLPSDIRRVAIDGGDRFASDVESLGAEFHAVDLDHDELPAIGPFDTVVCSDVLEHLIYPARTIEYAAGLTGEGIFFSHVPNEFHWRRTLRIMLGRADTVYFHHGCEEWENPHLRRFSDAGFRRLLKRHFAYNLPLTDLRYTRVARLFQKVGHKPPYCLQGGPTYASTNDAATFRELAVVKRRL